MAILVTGPSGSGKTSLSACLRARGLNGVDADAVPHLCGWFAHSGLEVTYPIDAGKEFLDNHRFLWRREALASFLETSRDVYLCGISRNVFEMIGLFDAVFFLKVSPDVLLARLQSATRNNPMGRTDYQREYSLFWASKNEAIARSLPIGFVDAERPIEEVADAVTGHYLTRRNL